MLASGTITCLLADVEGSSRLWEADRDGMQASMGRLDEIVTAASDRNGGVRPLEQGEGDSFVLGFARPSDALACALEIQLATAAEEWPHEDELRLRIAINTGEVDVRGGRFYGPPLNRSGRIRDLAHGGQTLVTRSTHDVVEDRLPDAAVLTTLGTARLRDLTRPEQIFQLHHPDLASDFPPLRSLDSLPNNLPVQLSSFIGRADEIVALRKLLEENRLVTLTGAGGCGKTRLALQVAADLLDRFTDGVWWIELATVTDPNFVSNAVAGSLGLKEIPARPLIETLKDHLAAKRTLVLLDNCEHLIGACAVLVESLLQECPELTIVTTSREPLALIGEVSWRVPSLSLPSEDEPESTEALGEHEAVQLFIERALLARPNFQVTNENAPAAASICSRLDGVPLAIELAAARTRMMTPQQILEGLDDRFRLLTGGGRSASSRHQTLEASVQWSYELLSEDERRLLRRLSVFVGTFDLDGAEFVCSGDGIASTQVLELLSNLVDRSLIQVEEGPRSRYRLLETIRQYGAQRLDETDEGDGARTRHLEHFAALSMRHEPDLRGSDVIHGLSSLDLEFSNLRAALGWAEGPGRSDLGLRIIGSIWLYFAVRGHYSEGRKWADDLLRWPDGDALVRARALIGVAQVEEFQGDYPSARAFAGESVELARAAGNERILAGALATLGVALAYSEPPSAIPVLEEADALCRATDEHLHLVDALDAKGVLELFAGDVAAAKRHLEEAAALARTDGNLLGLGVSLLFLGFALIYLGDLDEATGVLEEGLAIAHELRDRVVEGGCLIGLIDIQIRRDDRSRAGVLLDELAEDLTAGHLVLAIRVTLDARLAMVNGDLDRADELLDQAWTMVSAMELPVWIVAAAQLKADVSRMSGEFESAERAVQDAVEVGKQTGGLPLAIAMGAAARLARARGERQEAESLEHEALKTMRESHVHLFVPDALEGLAGVALDLESFEEAARLLGAAEARREESGYARPAEGRAAYDADMEALRGALSEEDLAAAWNEGHGMGLDEAIAFAERGRGERKRPSSGWEGLTPTEIEVVKLAAEGLTNPQIAERMFIARSTVKAHLSHIFSKLGVATRSELAAEAARRDL